MARNVRTYVGNKNHNGDRLPPDMVKQEFASRLYRMTRERDWSQSDLARAAGITRDAVSTYFTAKSLPEMKNAAKLAEALGISVDELLPSRTAEAIDRDPPAFEVKASAQNPGKSTLRINCLVSTKTALEIMRLIDNDKLPD